VATFTTPRPLPSRRLPVAAGAVALGLMLPVFALAGLDLRGWAFGAVLWVASQALGLIFDRAGIGEPNLRGSGVVAFGMMTRGILIVLAAIIVATQDPDLAVAGIVVYALAYTFELALGLALYFAGEPRR
jgi:hypothetical protein